MSKQAINWIALPGGVTSTGALRLSVFVAPRLTCRRPIGSLEEFPDFADWPARVKELIPRVVVRASTGATDKVIPLEGARVVSIGALDSELWKTLFSPKMKVRTFEFDDLSKRPIISYPVRGVVAFLRDTYQELALNQKYARPRLSLAGLEKLEPIAPAHTDWYLPGYCPPGSEKGDMAKLMRCESERPDRVMERLGKTRYGIFDRSDLRAHAGLGDGDATEVAATFDFGMAARFHHRSAPPRTSARVIGSAEARSSAESGPPKEVVFDFHTLTSALGDYPMLLRRLGLVLDLEVPLTTPPPAAGYIAFDPAFEADAATPTEHLRPWTAFEAGAQVFAAMPSPEEPELRRGMLDLSQAGEIMTREAADGGTYDLVQIDPDGAVLKVLNFARTVSKHGKAFKQHIPFGLDDEQGAPSLRSAGLGLARFGRAGDVHGRLRRGGAVDKALTSAGTTDPPPVLYAEDIVRGYRFDVFDSVARKESAVMKHREKLRPDDLGRWFSLCWRAGRYTLYEGERPISTLTMRAGDASPSGPCPVPVKIADTVSLVYDEGYVKAASTTSNENSDKKELYLHESLVRWSGWGLCAERPEAALVSGTVEDPRGENRQVEYISRLKGTEVKGGSVDMETEFRSVPGTLPRLRFGHAYRMRARTADLGGGGLCYDDDAIDDAMASRPVLYKRFDPVPPPAVVMASVRLEEEEKGEASVRKAQGDKIHTASLTTDGESLETMVIRSNHDANAEEWLTLRHLSEASVPEVEKSQEHVRAAEVSRRAALAVLLAGKHYRAVNERHIAPPNAAQQLCETHGVLDPLLESPEGRRRAFRICSRESRTFNDVAIPRVEMVDDTNPTDLQPLNADIVFLPVKGSERQEGAEGLPVHLEDQLQLPYLPDPIARGVAFLDLPGTQRAHQTSDLFSIESVADIVAPADGAGESSEAATVLAPHTLTRLRYQRAWPDLLPFKLRIADRATAGKTGGAPEWDPGDEKRGASLTVYLDKAEVARVRYSSFMDPRDVEIMGIWEWSMPRGRSDEEVLSTAENLRDPGWQPTDVNPMRDWIRSGLHWMYTPYREMVLVHAVQQPLSRPLFSIEDNPEGVLAREVGSTFVSFADIQVNMDAASTGRLELYARWSEETDPVSEPAPRDSLARLPETTDPGPLAGRLSSNPFWEDGERARFAAMVPNPSPGAPGLSESAGPAAPKLPPPPLEDPRTAPRFSGHAFGVDVPAGSPNVVSLRELVHLPTDKPDEKSKALLRYDFGDTKHRRIACHLVAATRFREYFPPELWADPVNVSRIGPAVEFNVPSSARPATPKILYVVPTFGWQTMESRSEVIVKRCGGGLRVYMDRPWYSSGGGELLAVVLRNDNTVLGTTIVGRSDPLQSYVTGWGIDPGWTSVESDAAAPLPAIGALPEIMADDVFKGVARREVMPNLTLSEFAGRQGAPVVKAIGYEPRFDPTRGLWYCDIEINTGSAYFPFVRLALARFQPNSVAGVELSPVVQLDFIQVAPDRAAAVVFGSDKLALTVAVSATPAQPSWGDEETPVLEDSSATGDKPRGDGKAPTPKADKGRYMIATLETTTGASGNLASLDTLLWTPVQDQETRLKPGAQAGDPRAVWLGSLTLPAASRRDGGTGIYRVVVKEYELLPADEGSAGAREFVGEARMVDRSAGAQVRTLYGQERLVFAASIYV